jgi:hypothetical protein
MLLHKGRTQVIQEMSYSNRAKFHMEAALDPDPEVLCIKVGVGVPLQEQKQTKRWFTGEGSLVRVRTHEKKTSEEQVGRSIH